MGKSCGKTFVTEIVTVKQKLGTHYKPAAAAAKGAAAAAKGVGDKKSDAEALVKYLDRMEHLIPKEVCSVVLG